MPLFSEGLFPSAWSVFPLVFFGIVNNSPQVFYNFSRVWFAEKVVRFTYMRMVRVFTTLDVLLKVVCGLFYRLSGS